MIPSSKAFALWTSVEVNAVATYFSEHSGEHYNPHVTIGVGTIVYLNALLAAPFPTFTFSAAGVSAYPVRQLRNCSETTSLSHKATMRDYEFPCSNR
jgi:hypothetical protein